MALFSVIIPTFNRAALLADTLRSVFAQRFTDFEVIVTDDGSTDDSAAVLQQYEGRLRVLHQSNQGPGAARNLAAAGAIGRYLAFLDSDDLWFPWTLDVYASIVIGTLPNPVFVAGKPAVFSDPAALQRIGEEPVALTAFADYYASGREWRWYSASSFVVRADVFKGVDGFAPVWINGEDADLAMRLGTAGPFVQVTAPHTFGYRDHGGSLVSQTRRTLEGVQYALRMEQQNKYPGGGARAGERRTILTRHFRPVMLTCMQERRFADAWKLYFSTWPWHLALGRLRFLVGFPVQMLMAAFNRHDGTAAS
jgi:glycosyltransferase involved in cell wall biosynthesis